MEDREGLRLWRGEREAEAERDFPEGEGSEDAVAVMQAEGGGVSEVREEGERLSEGVAEMEWEGGAEGEGEVLPPSRDFVPERVVEEVADGQGVGA